jgi:predicted alpha/beta-fold hydrolase
MRDSSQIFLIAQGRRFLDRLKHLLPSFLSDGDLRLLSSVNDVTHHTSLPRKSATRVMPRTQHSRICDFWWSESSPTSLWSNQTKSASSPIGFHHAWIALEGLSGDVASSYWVKVTKEIFNAVCVGVNLRWRCECENWIPKGFSAGSDSKRAAEFSWWGRMVKRFMIHCTVIRQTMSWWATRVAHKNFKKLPTFSMTSLNFWV